MYTHLLIATDGSVLAQEALEQGVALAKKLEAKVTIVTVTEAWHSVVVGDAAVGFPIDEYENANAILATQTLTKAQSVAIKAGLKSETVHVKDSYPADGIINTAEKLGCDLIVMASHGRRGLTRLLLGSQANNVVTHSTIPVLICR
ncbi:MAG TPA: universal stress protein [Hyphomicrobiaceae bacterium]|nr:universal stress protein [Hyphomicrobiaceae bacterium]